MHRQSEKNLLNSNRSSTCPYNVVNFGLLTADNDCFFSCTPANFNGFRALASLLHRRRSPEVNQTVHDIWPSPGRLLPPNGILHGAKFTLRPNLAFSYIGSITARHSSSGRQANFAARDKEGNCGTFVPRLRDLYSAGRPLRCASAHILVIIIVDSL